MTLRWSAPRAAAVALTILVNLSFGVGVYLFLNSSRGTLALQAKRPEDALATRNAPIAKLPGTLYLVQGGALYRLEKGRFATILNAGGWTQPTYTASGSGLVVVKRERWYSDLYLVDRNGQMRSQLTRNAGVHTGSTSTHRWAFYPRIGPDGNTLYFSWDPKESSGSYNVVLSIWQMSLSSGQVQRRRWTTPNDHTGGDVQPLPLPSGGLVYTKFGYDAKQTIRSQLWLTAKANTLGKPVTAPEADCAQPALSPDGKRLAMICTGDKQVASIEVASFEGGTLGPRQVVVTGVQAAQPTWAPDGSGLVYMAPAGLSGHFQLWWVPMPQVEPPPPATPASRVPGRNAAAPATPAATPTPTSSPSPPPQQPVRLTDGLNFDATSTIAWR